MLASFAVALLLWRGGGGLISGAITFGTLVAFLEYAQKFYNPIKDMSDKYNILQSALASSERIFKVLDTGVSPEYEEPARGRPAGAGPATEAEGAVPAIEYRDVWFSYPRIDGEAPGPGAERPPALRGVSFALAEGQTGAIVGATGSGKTTVLSLLCRFYEPQRGEILLFGRDVRDIPRSELRGMISLVLQEPFLFSGSVLENVASGGATSRPPFRRRRGPFRAGVGGRPLDRGGGAGAVSPWGSANGFRRAGAGARPEGPPARRGDFQRRPRDGARDPGGASPGACGAHLPRRGAPAVDGLSADRIIVMHKGRCANRGPTRSSWPPRHLPEAARPSVRILIWLFLPRFCYI
jgi:hypothetical protein